MPSRRWMFMLMTLLLVSSLALAACGDDEDDTDEDTDLDVAPLATEVIDEVEPVITEAADELEPLATEAAEEIGDALDEAGDEVAMVSGDPDVGATLFEEQGCSGCHAVDSDETMTGPSLQNIGNVADERTDDQDAVEYLHASLVEPNAYVVEGFPEDVMPSYDELSDEQLDNLVAYLLTLTG